MWQDGIWVNVGTKKEIRRILAFFIFISTKIHFMFLLMMNLRERISSMVRRACAAWNEGDETLALIHVALARLPPLPDRAADRRLYLAAGLIDAGMSPEDLAEIAGFTDAGDMIWRKAYDPDQPRRPAGPGGGQWVHVGELADTVGRQAINPGNTEQVQSALTFKDKIPRDVGYSSVTEVHEATASTMFGPVGFPVVLPNGEMISDPKSPTGYLMSPIEDLSVVAKAGRLMRKRFEELLSNPETRYGAILYFYSQLGLAVGQGGVFDYQREGSFFTGHTQFKRFRHVSNFNVGLYGQQAGLTKEEILSTAGLFARIFSKNYSPGEPYSLDPENYQFTVLGY